MIVEVESKRAKYFFKFYGKYNIITGDSGTGKTTFYKMIAAKEAGNGMIKLKSDLPIHAVGMNETEFSLTQYKNYILVIDEECVLLKKDDIASILKESPNYFLIITRKELDYLPVSIDNYHYISINGKNHELCTHYPRFRETEFQHINSIVTEDRRSGHSFFEEYYPSLTKEPANSKSEITKHLKDNYRSLRGVLIVYDASAFAFNAKSFFDYVKNTPVKILDWESFEHFILKQELFGISLTQKDCDYSHESLEQYSTEIIEKLIPYTKAGLVKCLKKDYQCSKCNRISFCKYVHKGFDYDLSINLDEEENNNNVTH